MNQYKGDPRPLAPESDLTTVLRTGGMLFWHHMILVGMLFWWPMSSVFVLVLVL